MTNEYYDYETDRINTNASFFSGGARVLVENKLGFKEVRTGIIVILCLIVATGYLLLSASHGASIFPVLFLLAAGIFMGLGYTAPPFKFSYRGIGEIVVAITHSPYVVVCGYVFQERKWDSSLPWLLSIPAFWATLAAIILAGIPDYSADKAVGKKTLAVILGSRLASMISICFAILALLSALFIWSSTKLNINSFVVTALIVFHCLMLCLAILNFIKKGIYNKRIDGIMQLALSYIIWFGIVPLIYLL
jgi:1,4-dihydroxy-2-naphthoate octaprenyltransferase